MKLLFAAATLTEIRPFLSRIGTLSDSTPTVVAAGTIIPLPPHPHFSDSTVLITGVGQAIAAYHLAAHLTKGYDVALQAGLGGSFLPELPKRSVVRVSSEVFGDLGAEDNGTFLDLIEMGFLDSDNPPFSKGKLMPLHAPVFDGFEHLPALSSVTVNRVLSEANSIQWIRARYAPAVVNMEGASFYYATSCARIPSIQLRAISDIVGPRDKGSWDIKGALETLNLQLLSWWNGA